jgi:hypothetical protein
MTNDAASAALGQLAGLAVAASGAAYLGVLTTMMVRGVPFPPPEPYSTVFHLLLLASVLAMVPLWCAVHLAACRSGGSAGNSFTFALECLGFGIFFSLACLLLIPVFGTGRLERSIAGTFAVIGVLSPAAAVGLALDSTDLMGLVAPLAWGVGPILAAVLVVRWLRRQLARPYQTISAAEA